MEIKLIAHSWFQIKAGGVTAHVDPSILGSKRLHELVKSAEKADLVLVTHHHADHCRKEIIDLVLKKGGCVLAPKTCAAKLAGGMIALKPGETYEHSGMSVRAVHAYNVAEGSSTVKAHKKGDCVGFLLTGGGRTVYHAGDTDLIPEMGSLGEIDVALLPIGGTYTMDVHEAAEAVERIRPKIAVPMHYIDADPNDFAKAVGGRARVAILAPNETLSLA